MAQMSQTLGAGDEEGLGIGNEFMMETPLLVLLNFIESRLPAAPEEIVAGLLAQVNG